MDALGALQTLADQEEHVKNYRPQILCLSGRLFRVLFFQWSKKLIDWQYKIYIYFRTSLSLGFPSARPAIIDFAYLLTKKQSLLICGHIVKERQLPRIRKQVIKNGYSWLHERRVKAFYVMVDNCNFDDGTQALLQAVGIGKLAPNIVLMGFKTNWQTCPRDELLSYFTTIQ